jgi:hypothetical protein
MAVSYYAALDFLAQAMPSSASCPKLALEEYVTVRLLAIVYRRPPSLVVEDLQAFWAARGLEVRHDLLFKAAALAKPSQRKEVMPDAAE